VANDPAPSGQEGSPSDPTLRLVPPLETPERVSFISGIEGALDYDYLRHAAESAENGATLLTEILVETGQLDKPEVIIQRQEEAKKIDQRRRPLIARQLDTGLTDQEKLALDAFSARLLELRAQLGPWEHAKTHIGKAYDYYHQTYFGKDSAGRETLDNARLDPLYDNTAQYDDIGLVGAVQEVRRNLPRPVAPVKGRPPVIDIGRQNVAEAERITRLLILEETGQISFEQE